MANDQSTKVLALLERIMRLLAYQVTKGDKGREAIAKLSVIGFQPKEIAEILGTSSGTVRVALVSIRRKKK